MPRLTRRSWILIGLTALALALVGTSISLVAAQGDSSKASAVAAAAGASCASPSYDGTNLDIQCVIPQSTTTATSTATVTAIATATVTETVTAGGTTTTTPPPSTTTPPPPTGWPSAATTGVPAGTTLTKSGSITVSQAGATVNAMDVSGCIIVNAPNVTIQNTRVRSNSCTYLIESRSTGLTIKNTETDGLGSTDPIGIGPDNFTAIQVNVHGTGDGIRTDNNVTVRDSWIHGLVQNSSTHNDCIQQVGGSNVLIQHNRIENNLSKVSAVMIGADLGNISNTVIDNNLLAGGGYTLYGGGPPSSFKITGVKITNNAFSTEFFPQSGQYGPMTATNAPNTTISGNYWLDGPNAGKAVNG